ncbi:MAG: hypothetical protein WB402_01180 [Sulfuricaulis sp.]|uniref:hypothetical protein n=1 Tax=Sulfuricaulis sp. TaxID=2003553 RepID=UPI003C4228F1
MKKLDNTFSVAMAIEAMHDSSPASVSANLTNVMRIESPSFNLISSGASAGLKVIGCGGPTFYFSNPARTAS